MRSRTSYYNLFLLGLITIVLIIITLIIKINGLKIRRGGGGGGGVKIRRGGGGGGGKTEIPVNLFSESRGGNRRGEYLLYTLYFYFSRTMVSGQSLTAG